MPDGSKLGKATLRGVESNGMILAEDELAIGTEHAGIMVLEPDGLVPGTPLKDVMSIATDVLELEITSNRPDCLGIYGVAREVHAATGAPLAPPPWGEDSGTTGEVTGATINVDCPDLCPRFTARVFEDVKIAPSPPWLKARLMAAGQRPISNVVDITNYVMLLTGQPLHAFDLDRVQGAMLTVRRARDGEQIETLDGQTRTLDSDMVLIEDVAGPTSIAGIMGGARSEVQPDTTRVLMEVANWIGANIHHTSLKLGLRSEASGRFEKQLQPEQTMEAQAVATQLMLDLTGATLVPGTIDIGNEGPPPKTIRLRDARIDALLGAPISRERCREILGALEFETVDADDGLDVTVPAFRRGDVTREADLIEEVARLDGLEKLPATLPSRHGASGRLTPRQRQRRRAADALTAQGLDEVVGWSFAHPELADRLRLAPEDARRNAVALENPISTDAVAPAHDDSRIAARRHAIQPIAGCRHAAAVRSRGGVPPDKWEWDKVGGAFRRRLGRAPPRAVPPGRAADGHGPTASWRDAPTARRRLLRRQGCAPRADGRAPGRLAPRGRRTSRSCTRGGRRASRSPARAPGGSGRSTRSSRPSGTSATRSLDSSSTSTRCPSRRSPCIET